MVPSQAFDGKKCHVYAKLLPEGVGNGELMAEGEGSLSIGAGDKRWVSLCRFKPSVERIAATVADRRDERLLIDELVLHCRAAMIISSQLFGVFPLEVLRRICCTAQTIPYPRP